METGEEPCLGEKLGELREGNETRLFAASVPLSASLTQLSFPLRSRFL